MNNAEIQIQFPEPGIWTVMSMSAVYADADGFNRVDTYTQDTLPPAQIPGSRDYCDSHAGRRLEGKAGLGPTGYGNHSNRGIRGIRGNHSSHCRGYQQKRRDSNVPAIRIRTISADGHRFPVLL